MELLKTLENSAKKNIVSEKLFGKFVQNDKLETSFSRKNVVYIQSSL